MRRGLIFALAFALAACSRTGDEAPRLVAEKFLNAVAGQRFEEARKYGTPRMQQMLDVQSSVATIGPKKAGCKCTILSCTVDGDKAFVVYKTDEQKEADVLRLIKTSDKWLVGH
jgi:hypothetical protein